MLMKLTAGRRRHITYLMQNKGQGYVKLGLNINAADTKEISYRISLLLKSKFRVENSST